MLSFFKRSGMAVILTALLQGQTEYQSVPPPDAQMQEENAPGDCSDCAPAGEVDPQQELGKTDSQYPSRSTTQLQKSRRLAPTHGGFNGRDGADPNLDTRPVSAEPPTEFQRFVQSSTGQLLPIFGSALFQSVPSTFAPADRLPAKTDYIVGPGDEIELHVWGQVNFSERLTVDAAGDIFLSQVGRISVSGARFAQLREVLQSALARVYRNFDLNVNMGQLRSMQIFVLGQARRPGTYTVSSLSTLVNALFDSGGPSSRGSLRNVQLKRGGQVLTTLDLYDFLLQGDKTKDVPLLSGDIIFIPDAGARVAIEGSVETPAIYEVKDDNCFSDVLRYAGGISSTASGQRAILERIDQHASLHSDNIDLTPQGLSARPQDGDVIRILPVMPRFERTVTLRGNVSDAARFPWHEGMKVSDLIPTKESLLTRGYWRTHNGLLNQSGSEVSVRDKSRATNSDSSLAGVTIEDTSVIREFNKQNDLQPLAPDIDWNYATIERLDNRDFKPHLISFNLGRIVIEHDPAADLVLEPNDVLTVFSNADVSVPVSQQTKYVRVEGEVKAAGIYSVRSGETLQDVVVRAGGLTPNAYLYGAQFSRESTRKQQQKRYDDFLDQLERDMSQRSALSSGGINAAGAALTAQATLASERALIQRLRQTPVTGRIVLDLEPNSTGSEALPRLPLENGDSLLIPAVSSTVSVFGMVYNQGSFLYSPDSRLGDYLAETGGPTRYADRRHVFVIRADGSVVSAETRPHFFSASFETLRMYPGDTIFVPTYVRRTAFLQDLLDWSQVVGNVGLGAAAINVLK